MPLFPLVLVANARMPSQRAQSLQIAQAAAAFERAGAPTTLLHAQRRDTPPVEDEEELWDYYGVPAGKRPAVRAIPCIDWIDRVPRKWQYLPARMQELSFARNAARCALAAGLEGGFAGTSVRVLSRELETAYILGGRSEVFIEIHRVPGGRLRRRWLLKGASFAAGIIAISGGVRQDLVELGIDDEDILVEHDAFEPALFRQQPSKQEARAELGMQGDRPLVVYTGGLLQWKGVDLLVEAARSLPQIRFLIAGGMDADVAALREQARALPNVRIDGFQPPRRVPLYLAAGDLGVVPNRSQPAISARYTSPLKIFEAMAAGLPLVCSDLPSMREILSEEEAQFFKADDAEALAEAIEQVAGNDVHRARLAARMLARAPEHSWDARAARILTWMEARV